jgi:hypothetical protein
MRCPRCGHKMNAEIQNSQAFAWICSESCNLVLHRTDEVVCRCSCGVKFSGSAESVEKDIKSHLQDVDISHFVGARGIVLQEVPHLTPPTGHRHQDRR